MNERKRLKDEINNASHDLLHNNGPFLYSSDRLHVAVVKGTSSFNTASVTVASDHLLFAHGDTLRLAGRMREREKR